MGKKPKKQKITNESLLAKMKFDFSRDAEWFKRTNQKIQETKEELNKNFYDENKKKQKIDFIHKLKDKLKDYKDAIKFEARYKKVRFVERRKLERKLNHINKSIESEKDEEKLKELKKDKEKIVDDINYVKYYPRTYKYYSLFPNKDSDNKEMIKKREKMKQKIKFYLNGKKNKRHENNDDNNEIEDYINEKDNENDNIKDHEDNIKEKENNKEKKKNNDNKNEKKNEKRKEKEKEKNNSGQDYESFKKKKVFKDDFFELDE
jgi:hypothetical protein